MKVPPDSEKSLTSSQNASSLSLLGTCSADQPLVKNRQSAKTRTRRILCLAVVNRFSVTDILLDREYPNRSTFGNFREFSWEQAVQRVLVAARISAPSGNDGDVLLPVHCKRSRRCEDSGVR